MPKDKKVYVIGMSGIEEELKEEGISYIGGTVRLSTLSQSLSQSHSSNHVIVQDPTDNTLEPFSLANFIPDPSVGAVLCGLDTAINYTKLSKAFQYLLRNPGCAFLATNEDSTYPTADGLLPGAGSISAPLRYAYAKDPISIGKPAGTMLECIKAK